jgi:4,5-dihydroxyphthalate decarboxylase
MSATALKLDIVIARYGHTAALKDGAVSIDRVTPNFVDVNPIIAAFRRMVRSVEFDVCEMAPATYMIARSFGAPFKALPIFIMRRFHHGGFVVHPNGGVRQPKDIEGKRVGVRAYSVSTGIWTRGIFQNEYGVDLSKTTWMVDDEEHVQQLRLPANVQQVPEGKSLVGMMATGELQAAFSGPAGIGRAGAPKDGWDNSAQQAPAYSEIFDNAAQLETQWFQRTGIYPTHGLIVVKDTLLQAHPWLAQSLYEAFVASKRVYLAQLQSGNATDATDTNYLALSKIVGDPLPYGVADNLPAIKALILYSYQQKLIPREYDVDEMFVRL